MKEIVLTSENTKNLYQNCEDTTLDVWLNIMRTKDAKYIVKSGVVPKEEILEAQVEKINKEFLALRGQSDAVIQYDKIQYKRQLEIKVISCYQIIALLNKRAEFNLLTKEHLEKYVARFKFYGFRINKDKPLNEELEVISSELQALQTTINILHAEIYPEVEEEATTEEKNVFGFYNMLLTYQRILNIGVIDTTKTTLMQFSVMEKQVEMTVKNKNNNRN